MHTSAISKIKNKTELSLISQQRNQIKSLKYSINPKQGRKRGKRKNRKNGKQITR